MSARRRVTTAAVAFALYASPAAAQFQTVSLAGLTNNTFTGGLVSDGTLYPFGFQTLGGVPFTIDQSGQEARGWFAYSAASGGGAPVSLVVPVGVFGVTSVYTLINTLWGANGPAAYASLTFTGSGGATFTKDLVGNVDIRDYLQNTYTNTINGTTSVEVFGSGRNRLDRQMIVLPTAFATQTLTSVTLNDTGTPGFQRTFLAGVTVDVGVTATPEPATFVLVGGGLALVGLVARRRRTS